MEKDKLSIKENKIYNDHTKKISSYLGTLQMKLSNFDSQESSGEDGGKKTLQDKKTLQYLSSYNIDAIDSNVLEIKIKSLNIKGFKQIKTKIHSGIEKEINSQQTTKDVNKKSIDVPSLEGKVHESLDTFIRQTMGCEPYVSFSSRPSEKPLQKILEHQQAMNKCIKSLKVDIDICDCQGNNANIEPHQGKQNISVDHLIDLSNWPLLSPSRLQLQKCDKCSYEFFSSFNHQRHIRTHRRISHGDKEDLILKRKNVATFWDKLSQEEAQQIFASSRKYDMEDLSGEIVVSHLHALRKKNNPITLPPTYTKAGQVLLDMLDNKHIVFPLLSEQILSILDEANERTFLCSQGDVSKIGLEEKNLVASLGFIVEQTLVKAWMENKDVEALRNQQELVKEEEAIQMKREKNVSKRKKKKEKSKQRGLKEHKGGIIQLALNKEDEPIDEENPSFDIVEKDNSPTASSTSINSSGLENSLLEYLEIGINGNERIQNVGAYGGHLKTSKEFGPDSIDEKGVQQQKCDLVSYGKEKYLYSKFSSFNQIKIEDKDRINRILEQDQSVLESCKHTSLRSCRESIKVDNHDSYQRPGWILDPQFQDGMHQNSQRALQKPLIVTPYMSNIKLSTNLVPRFYRGKPPSLKGNTPFPVIQQWAKKTQMPIAIDFITKNNNEDESSQIHEVYTNSSNFKDIDQEHSILACKMNVDVINNLKGGGKEELRTCDQKELLQPIVPSVVKMVTQIGCLNNISTTSFNLNVNSEDWPPLSNSYDVYYSKHAKKYSLTSYQCEVNSRPPKKFNIDKGGDHKVGLAYKVEGSNAPSTPPLRRLINQTTSRSTTTSLQKGIMIGSVSVPINEFVHPSKSGLGSVGKRINSPLLAHQSYTTILASPPIQYTLDPMVNTIGQQRQHDEINHLKYEDSSTVQVRDSYGDQIYCRTPLIRSTPFIKFNVRHTRGPTYSLGDRGEREVLSKQPAWSSGQVRNLPQKVWRPIRPMSENVDSKLGGEIHNETNLNSSDEKINESLDIRELKSDDATPSQSIKCTQVQDLDVNEVDESSTPTMKPSTEIEDTKCIMDTKMKNENAPKDMTSTSNESLINSNIENLQNCEESIQADPAPSPDRNNTCQSFKHNACKMDSNCSFHGKKNNNEKMDDMAHVETNSNHLAWIAEALEFHFTRWQLGLKDPQTIVGTCEEHPELQTSRWMDFMSTLPSITTRSSCYGQ